MDDLTAHVEAAPRLQAWLARHPGAEVLSQKVTRDPIGDPKNMVMPQQKRRVRAVALEVQVRRILGPALPAAILDNATKVRMIGDGESQSTFFDDTLFFYVGYDYADPD